MVPFDRLCMISISDFKISTFLKSNIRKIKLLLHNRKLYLTYGMVLCLVTLTDLVARVCKH